MQQSMTASTYSSIPSLGIAGSESRQLGHFFLVFYKYVYPRSQWVVEIWASGQSEYPTTGILGLYKQGSSHSSGCCSSHPTLLA